MIEISSAKNSIVKHLSKLNASREYRHSVGLFAVEGIKMVTDCVGAGYQIAELFISQQKAEQFSKITNSSETVYIVSDELFPKLSDTVTPQGIIATVAMQAGMEKPQGNILILDGVRDPGNIGAIIRTAAAAGFRNIYMHSCVDPYNPKAVRSSMSGIFHVSLTEAAVEELQGLKAGRLFILADMQGSDMYSVKLPDMPVAIILGGEADGATGEIKALADRTVSIPMSGMESLNVAVSAGILMYQLTRKN